MDILLFGIQGSGKGTQGKELAKHYGLKIFDMGQELRTIIESETAIGEEVRNVIGIGNMVDDTLAMEIVEKFIKDTPKNQPIVFDGIPRNLDQLHELLKFLKAHGREAYALEIKISKKEATKRLTKRRMCSKCKEIYPAHYESEVCTHCGGSLMVRQDDQSLSSIETRFKGFDRYTKPVIQHFADINRLIEIDGEQPIEEVTKETIEKAGFLFS